MLRILSVDLSKYYQTKDYCTISLADVLDCQSLDVMVKILTINLYCLHSPIIIIYKAREKKGLRHYLKLLTRLPAGLNGY